MIRGIDGIVTQEQLELGRFYLDPGYGRGTTLFQWVRNGRTREGAPDEGALVFARDDEPCLELTYLPTSGPWISLPPVHVRVDPPSAAGTAFTTSFTRSMFAVQEDAAIVAAVHDTFHWTPINILTGRVMRPGHQWVAFSRWSLVVDEAGEEISIVSFGEAPSA